MEPIKLDYSLKTAQERANFVANLPKEQVKSKKYIEILADYIISAMTKDEKKKKEIITDNRMITINKRETSYQGLVNKFENGEDGLYNLMINDKNVLLTPKVSITEKDVAEIPALKTLKDSIESVKRMEEKATGKRKFLLKKQLIEMYQEQYIIKDLCRNTCVTPGGNGGNTIKNLTSADLIEHIIINEEGEPESDGLINFFNWNHISALLCNYSALKEDCWGKFESDLWYSMLDLDNLVEDTLNNEKYQLYYKLLIYKIDGKQNIEIQELLEKEFGITHSVEYLSSLWRNKIPKLIAERAKENYLNWYYTYQERGKWKTCTRCGQTKLATNRFFSKNSTSKDGWYSICKQCRNEKSAEARKK